MLSTIGQTADPMKNSKKQLRRSPKKNPIWPGGKRIKTIGSCRSSNDPSKQSIPSVPSSRIPAPESAKGRDVAISWLAEIPHFVRNNIIPS